MFHPVKDQSTKLVDYLHVAGNIQMFQAYGPLTSSVFSLESSSLGFWFSNQGDVFQSSVPNVFENQPTNGQYAFQDGTAGTNLQQRSYYKEDLQSIVHINYKEQSHDNGFSIWAQSFHVRRRPHENGVLMVSIDQPWNAWIQSIFSIRLIQQHGRTFHKHSFWDRIRG